jgi:4-hydroxy-tetrahydrodipicolinate reductase
MNILLIGYGKMGKTIERIATEKGHHIVGRVDANNMDAITAFSGQTVDVAIEFTQPESAFKNVSYCLQNQIPVVCGTTGWLHDFPQAEKLCKENNGTLFYASNYSIGVNLFFRLNKIAAQLFNHYPQYDVAMEEIHHTEKKDAPSGTAITLAQGILQHLSAKKRWTIDAPSSAEDLPIGVVRENNVPGTHSIMYNSTEDSITLTHTAHSREGFALGAVLAAEWVQGKKGVLGMTEMLGF